MFVFVTEHTHSSLEIRQDAAAVVFLGNVTLGR